MLRFVVIAACALLSLEAVADLKITVSNDGSAETHYYQGPRSRHDWRSSAAWRAKPDADATVTYGPRRAIIYQCDRHRLLDLDLDHRQYTAQELDEKGQPQGEQIEIQATPARRAGGRVHVSYSIRDTGERRSMFGRTARHLIVTRTQTAQPGACATSQQMVQEGWFIDFEEPPGDCRPPEPKPAYAALVSNQCEDKYTFDGPSPAGAGYALEATTTVTTEARNAKGVVKSVAHSAALKVTEFSTEPLDPALFELPTGFKHVDKLMDQPPPPLMIRARSMWENAKRTVKGWWPW